MSVGTNEFEIFSRVVCKQNVRIGRNKRLIRSTMKFKLEDAEFDEKGVRRKFIEDSKIEGYPPYYPSSFFKAIKQVHDETPLNVKRLFTSQWVRILTEDGLTMETVDTRQYRPCKAEISAASNDWPLSWRLCRLPGLSSEQSSFNFKLLHGLLVTKERLQQLTPATSATCTHCHDLVNEDLQHALLHCQYNDGVGQSLLSALQNLSPTITPSSLLRLELDDIPEDSELSAITFISTCLMEVWTRRFNKTKIRLYEIRATLEARCILLRETRFASQLQTFVTL